MLESNSVCTYSECIEKPGVIGEGVVCVYLCDLNMIIHINGDNWGYFTLGEARGCYQEFCVFCSLSTHV